MTVINKLSVAVTALFVVSLMFLILHQDVYAGSDGPLNPGCCQFDGREIPSEMALNSEVFECSDKFEISDQCERDGGVFIPGAICNGETGFCTGGAKNVPTVSEWGLITTAAVLGFIGFIAVRRRKAVA